MRFTNYVYVYFVRKGYGGKFRVFKKPYGKDDYTKAHGVLGNGVKWRDMYWEAQEDLKRYAKAKGLTTYADPLTGGIGEYKEWTEKKWRRKQCQ